MSDRVPLPDATYLLVASRLIPDLDAGFTISVLRRALDIERVSGTRPVLLTVDAGSTAEHDAHRRAFVARGLLRDPAALRNLFDDARSDPSWLREAAHPGEPPDVAARYRDVADDAGRTIVRLPVLERDPAWHRSTAPVLIPARGQGSAGWLPGFGALYRAWLRRIAAEAQAAADRPVVILCESRQVGELLVADGVGSLGGNVRILHTTHACHLAPPYSADAPTDRAWLPWFAVADRFDAVLWLTPAQRDDVGRRHTGIRSFVAPHAAPPALPRDPAGVVPGRIVMLNSLTARKRVDHALRALAAVRGRVPHAHLHVYGDGAERGALEQLAAELGLGTAVAFHGHSPDAADALETAEVLLLTSTNEGLPLVLLEALSRGCPAIAYDARYGPLDVLAGGGGMLVPSGDVEALTDALAELLGDRSLRARLSEQALEVARARGDVPAVSALAAAVSTVLDGVPSPGLR